MKSYELSHCNLYFDVNTEYVAIFNSITQVLSFFAKRCFSFNSDNQITGVKLTDSKLTSLLFEKGFIVDEEIAQEDLIRVIYEDRFLSVNQGAGLTIIPTFQCNFDCCYCYQKECQVSSNSEFMNEETIIKVIEFTNSIIQPNLPFYLNFFGGEPLLKPDIFLLFIEKIKPLCDKKHSPLFVHVTTNGYNFTEKIVTSLLGLIKYNNQFSVQITLDGTKDTHDSRRYLHNGNGSFSRIIENLESITNHPDIFNLILRINVDKSNIKYWQEILNYLHDKHLLEKLTPVVDSVFLKSDCYDNRNRSIDPLNLDESINIYFELREIMNKLLPSQNLNNRLVSLTKHTHDPCVAQRRNFFVVDPDGDLFKCYIDAGDKNKSIGNIDKPLTYNNKVLLKYLSFKPWNLSECKKCSVFPLCFGHCIVKQWDGFSLGLSYCSSYKEIIQRELFFEIKDFAFKNGIPFPHKEYKQGLFIKSNPE